MTGKLIERTHSAYAYPLLIRSLFRSGLARASSQETVYSDRKRLSYQEFGERVGRLASGLVQLGITPGQTVGVMDWDSHRYLVFQLRIAR